MLGNLYSRWMYAWETALTTRDTNRIVRPVEWGFDWLADLSGHCGAGPVYAENATDHASSEAAMLALNDCILRHREEFFSYAPPTDYLLEERHPQLFPTNVRPETLRRDAKLQRLADEGKMQKAQFLRFTSPVRTPFPENDRVNARWYPAPEQKQQGKPRQAMIVMPQWNADAFSHNGLCSAFNRFGVSALRLSKPYHDIRRPAELERADYAVSSNVGRTIAACRQAVIDVRCAIDWLESQGYEQFGILGTSLGSCYAFLASAIDPRLRVTAFNHASMSFGDVVWTGQSTRHIRQAFADAGLTQERLRDVWASISPSHYMDQFAAHPKKVLVVHATYDLTFLAEYSAQVLASFRERGVDFVSKVLPCGHYTTGETPFKFMDGWYLGSFVYSAFRELAENRHPAAQRAPETPEMVRR
ncbi:MAG TPA: abhydrolase domain-containing 18 [Acidobacteriaceae bacterium]|jgi:dienelactone hydrolase|nr:abhydrolase domain-containing 18 [Acidobacteriaceae bacterium]